MTAINNNVILEKVNNETTMSGIILTSTNNNSARVIEISNSITTNLKIGDVVIYKQDKAINFENNGKKYIVVNFDDILVVL